MSDEHSKSLKIKSAKHQALMENFHRNYQLQAPKAPPSPSSNGELASFRYAWSGDNKFLGFKSPCQKRGMRSKRTMLARQIDKLENAFVGMANAIAFEQGKSLAGLKSGAARQAVKDLIKAVAVRLCNEGYQERNLSKRIATDPCFIQNLKEIGAKEPTLRHIQYTLKELKTK